MTSYGTVVAGPLTLNIVGLQLVRGGVRVTATGHGGAKAYEGPVTVYAPDGSGVLQSASIAKFRKTSVVDTIRVTFDLHIDTVQPGEVSGSR